MKSIAAQSVSDVVVLPSWARFSGRTSFKEFVTRWSSQTDIVFDNAGLLKSNVSGRGAQIQQVIVNTMVNDGFCLRTGKKMKKPNLSCQWWVGNCWRHERQVTLSVGIKKNKTTWHLDIYNLTPMWRFMGRYTNQSLGVSLACRVRAATATFRIDRSNNWRGRTRFGGWIAHK